MAVEVFANLAETTLASSYTSGGSSISVASAALFPTIGTFRVALGNSSKTIFRVDSVSGTTFTGAAEAFDGNASSGDKVTLVASKATAERFLQSPVSGEQRAPSGVSAADFYGPVSKLVALDQSSWSWVNQTSGVSAAVDQASGVVYLRTAARASGLNVALRDKAAPSTPYTITVLVVPLWSTTISGPGIALRQSSSGKFINLFLDRGSVVVNKDTSPTAFSSQPWNVGAAGHGGPVWLRMSDDGTTIKFSYSKDGVNFIEALSETRTTFLLTTGPDRVAITCTLELTGLSVGGGSFLSWVET